MVEQQLSPIEAEIQYQHRRRLTTTHAATCDECNFLSWTGEMCDEAKKPMVGTKSSTGKNIIDRTSGEITRDNFRYQAQIAANLAYLLNSHLNTYSLIRTASQREKVLNCIVDIRNVLNDIEQDINEDERTLCK